MIPCKHGFYDSLFADDIKIYTEVIDTNSIVEFQNSTDALCEWASNWQMELSIGKYHHMRVGLSFMPPAAYTVNTCVLDTVQNNRDLGIIIDSKLALANHIDHIVFKAKQRACLISRCF